MIDKIDWSSLKKGDFITLKDSQSIEDSLKINKNANGMEYIVESKTLYNTTDLNFKSLGVLNYVYELHSRTSDDVLFLLVCYIDYELSSLQIGFIQPEFGFYLNRNQLLDLGLKSLFKEPDDENDFEPCDLELTDVIELEVYGKVNSYEELYEGIQIGKHESGEYPVIYKHWECPDKSVENPHLVWIEEKYLDNDGTPLKNGGFIKLITCCGIDSSLVEVLVS